MSARARRLVLFVGAGSSRACGYPVTSEILPRILDRLAQRKFGDRYVDAHRAALRKLLHRLVPGRRKFGVPMITEVLSIIDHCLDSDEDLLSASSPKSLSLRDARWLLGRAIAEVIRKVHKRDVRTGEIADWILTHRRVGTDVTVISTNYDISLDRALFTRMLPSWNEDYWKTDFGFTWRDPDDGKLVHPAFDPLVKLYKLHGSLNWLTCQRCGHIMVSFAWPIVKNADGNDKYAQCFCDYKPMRAVLVAPSLVRSYRDRNLLSVWRSATEALRLADQWIFAGYSMPSEDVAVRALLLRAVFSRPRPPQVQAVSADTEPLARFQRLFPGCQYTASGLRAFLDGTHKWEEISKRRRRAASAA